MACAGLWGVAASVRAMITIVDILILTLATLLAFWLVIPGSKIPWPVDMATNHYCRCVLGFRRGREPCERASFLGDHYPREAAKGQEKIATYYRSTGESGPSVSYEIGNT